MIILRNNTFSKTSLKEIDSKEGKIIVSPSSIIGIREAKKASNKADSEGKEDIEIIKISKESGKEAGRKVGTALGVGFGTIETAKNLKKISDFEKNPEKLREAGKEWVKKLQEKIPGGEYKEATEEVIIRPGKKIAKKLLKNPKKYGKFAKLAAVGGGSLTIISSRELGKAIGKRSAEINTVDRLEKRHELSKK